MTEAVDLSFLSPEERGLLERLHASPRFAAPNGGPLVHIVGARPNFVKLAPLFHALAPYRQKVIHSGQHYDRSMSGSFFEILDLPEPDLNLSVAGGSHAEQTAKTMIGLEQAFAAERPAAVIVYGDVNSTLAASLVAAKMHIPAIHVEAGLRSGDRDMPEEINRLVTDRLSDLLLTPSRDGNANLLNEGAAPESVMFVGNIMIDTLVRLLPKIEQAATELEGLPERFVLVTLHRPSNVDDTASLARITAALDDIAAKVPIVFPVHPRTRAKLDELGWAPPADRVTLGEPLDYVSFVALQKRSLAVVTDSGGVQEETTFLGRPCLTLRTTTERPVTVDSGSNILLGDDPASILPELEKILSGQGKAGSVPEFWDGKTAYRIRAILEGLDLCQPA